MPSKTSKTKKQRPQSPWKFEPACSEQDVARIAKAFAAELKPGDRVLLSGELGAGKSTFARAILRGLGVKDLAEGSPTFSIVHEYHPSLCPVSHLDLYRLDDFNEAEATGMMDSLWDRGRIVLIEWVSQIPELEAALLDPAKNGRLGFRNWSVVLTIDLKSALLRSLEIKQL